MLRFAEYLELQDFRHTTKCNYYRALRIISEHFKCDPCILSEEQLRCFFVHLRCELHWAPKSTRQFLAAAKHFYRGMLGREYAALDAIKARDRESLPTVLSVEELRRLFRAIRLNRYRVPLLLIYSCGLRVRECTHLSVNDIDGSANRLFIRDGKGGKDRYTILSTRVYRLLQDYWRKHHNRHWVFPAVGRGSPDADKVRARMRVATEPMDTHGLGLRLLEGARAAEITKRVTCHILRHSFATHLAAAGVPLHQLQAYLGHAHIETTTVYTHLTPINHIEAIGYIDALIEPILRR